MEKAEDGIQNGDYVKIIYEDGSAQDYHVSSKKGILLESKDNPEFMQLNCDNTLVMIPKVRIIRIEKSKPDGNLANFGDKNKQE